MVSQGEVFLIQVYFQTCAWILRHQHQEVVLGPVCGIGDGMLADPTTALSGIIHRSQLAPVQTERTVQLLDQPSIVGEQALGVRVELHDGISLFLGSMHDTEEALGTALAD
jgi:hypothetical protein